MQSDVFFLVIVLKRICSKCKLPFEAENLRTSLILNGLCLVSPILNTKNIISLTHCQQVIVAESFKRTSFLAHVSHKNLKHFFLAYIVSISKADKWVKFGLQMMKL